MLPNIVEEILYKQQYFHYVWMLVIGLRLKHFLFLFILAFPIKPSLMHTLFHQLFLLPKYKHVYFINLTKWTFTKFLNNFKISKCWWLLNGHIYKNDCNKFYLIWCLVVQQDIKSFMMKKSFKLINRKCHNRLKLEF